MTIDPVRIEALRLAKASLGWRPSPKKLIETALIFEVYLLGKSWRWGGTPSGASTLSHIAAEARPRPTPAPSDQDSAAVKP